MFKTFNNTLDSLHVSWRLLNANRTLLVLPAISGVVTILILLLSAGVLSVGGAFNSPATGEANFRQPTT